MFLKGAPCKDWRKVMLKIDSACLFCNGLLLVKKYLPMNLQKGDRGKLFLQCAICGSKFRISGGLEGTRPPDVYTKTYRKVNLASATKEDLQRAQRDWEAFEDCLQFVSELDCQKEESNCSFCGNTLDKRAAIPGPFLYYCRECGEYDHKPVKSTCGRCWPCKAKKAMSETDPEF